tara:strand:+ start:3612 stop:4331 length:720 start_codon:yes stop_codon:yes gene_type:complete
VNYYKTLKMKKGLIRILKTVVIILLLASCQPAVVFGEPQPVAVKPLSTIPNMYKGIYWCKVDSASLYVDDKVFVRRKEFLIKTTKEEVVADPDLELVNGQLYVKDWEGYFPITEKGDTLVSQIIIRDTIFAIGDAGILKPFKGHLVLNLKLKEDAWEVLVVSQRRGDFLSIARADIPDNLAQLDSITTVGTLKGTDSIRTQIYLKPTAKEFERIYDEGLLFDVSCTEYERIFPLKEIIY